MTLKTLQKEVQSGRKAVSKFELRETTFEGQSGTKSPVKPTWSEKITVLSTFLKSSFNSQSNNLKKHYKISYSQDEKRLSKFELTETKFERTIRNKTNWYF